MYDLCQIPYDYTVEVTNSTKGLDLIECLKNYGQRILVGYSPWGHKELDTTEYLHFHSLSWGWSCSLSPVQCHEPLSLVHQALYQI